MIRLLIFTLVLLIGLSIAIVKSDIKPHNIHYKRSSRSNEQLRSLRNLMGKLIDTETNTIYTVDGEKEQAILFNPEVVTPLTPSIVNSPINYEQIACLAACHSCIEEYPIGNRKKKAADNCGPMCDCADSCFQLPIEQVKKIYGQSTNTRGDKNCWWRTYTEMQN